MKLYIFVINDFLFILLFTYIYIYLYYKYEYKNIKFIFYRKRHNAVASIE